MSSNSWLPITLAPCDYGLYLLWIESDDEDSEYWHGKPEISMYSLGRWNTKHCHSMIKCWTDLPAPPTGKTLAIFEKARRRNGNH